MKPELFEPWRELERQVEGDRLRERQRARSSDLGLFVPVAAMVLALLSVFIAGADALSGAEGKYIEQNQLELEQLREARHRLAMVATTGPIAREYRFVDNGLGPYVLPFGPETESTLCTCFTPEPNGICMMTVFAGRWVVEREADAPPGDLTVRCFTP